MSGPRRLPTTAVTLGLASVLLWSSQSSADFSSKKRDVSIPEPGADLTAYRVDVDVWGWNRSFTEMAAVGSEVRRGSQGEHRGERLVLFFPIDSLAPRESIQAGVVTQPALPNNPAPLDDIRDAMWIIGNPYLKLYPMRPKRKHFAGAMLIEPIWESLEVDTEVCQPVVGFLMKYQNRVRYQPHQPLLLQASCPDLRLTDTRIYWAKKDLGAVMMRFDYSPNDNEMSIRFPLSVAWKLGRELKLLIRSAEPAKSPAAKKTQEALAKYGGVRVENGGGGESWEISYKPTLRYLAHRIERELNGRLVSQPPPEGVDIVLSAAAAQPVATEPDAPTPTKAKPADTPPPTCGGLLRDCP